MKYRDFLQIKGGNPSTRAPQAKTAPHKQNPIQIKFDLIDGKVYDLDWKTPLNQFQVAALQNMILDNRNFVLQCVTEESEYPSIIINSELTSTRFIYNDENEITGLWAYFKTKDDIGGRIVKFIIFFDKETQQVELSLNTRKEH